MNYEPQLGPPYGGNDIGCGSMIIGVILIIVLMKACGVM